NLQKMLLEKQMKAQQEQQAAAAAAAADAATDSQQQLTQDELPPGWQIGFRVPTEEPEPEQQSPRKEQLQQQQQKQSHDPRAHFDREPIDVRAPRPPFRGTLIDDPRLSASSAAAFARGREVAPSAIARESKSVVKIADQVDEF
ncbi:hypothetical protein PFISCL1PPCAC_3840, partial [Pristionchus fissidentatus]